MVLIELRIVVMKSRFPRALTVPATVALASLALSSSFFFSPETTFQ